MPDSKITALTSISTSTDPANDPLVIVDLSDTSMAATGTTKKVTLNQLLGASGTATLASATITGDLTVDTSTLKVDSANNVVGIGTASPTAIAGYTSLTINTPTTGSFIDLNVAGVNKTRLLGTSSNFNIETAGTIPITMMIGGQNQYRVDTAGVFTWYDGAGGTRMTLNATGLGVGASPTGYGILALKKDNTSAPPYIVLDNRGTGGTDTNTYTQGGILFGAFRDVSNPAYIASITVERKSAAGGASSTGDLIFGTASTPTNGVATERLRIDAAGQVGIGVTPSAWGSGYTALQNRQTCWFSTSARDLNLGANVYVDGVGYKYIATAAASNYVQYQGAHSWYTAASGTAGNAITFTQAMTLTAAGELLVGTTSSPSGAKVGAITKLSGVSAEGTAAINVSTTPVAISRSTGVCGLFFVMGYNASGGAQGWYLVASTGSGTPTVISSGGTPGLTLTFTMAGGQLNAQTASGTFVVNAFSITA